MSDIARKWRLEDWRLPLSLLFLVGLALNFWLSSRYPALNEKAIMGGDAPVLGLSFDVIYEILPTNGFFWEVLANTLNWLDTNKKGMIFGVLFGAAALTLLGLIQRRSFKSGFLNSAMGTLIGAPLGVCVNCAMPIAMGLHSGRMRLETTLSALFASPTLNIIVVTMSFSLLPFAVAATKLVVSLLLVLLIVPLLCRFVLTEETVKTGGDFKTTVQDLGRVSEPGGLTGWMMRSLAPVDVIAGRFNLWQSLVWFCKTYLRSLFFLALITVPMMFVAGLLGALMTVFISPTEFSSFLPRQETSAVIMLVALVGIALVASAMPTPIAFDVVLTIILLNTGLKHHYGMTVLIALGTFSIYPFIILWQVISKRTALYLWGIVCALAIGSGVFIYLLTPTLVGHYRVQKYDALKAVEGINWPQAEALPAGLDIAELQPRLSGQQARLAELSANITTTGPDLVSVEHVSFSAHQGGARPAPTDTQLFTRVAGPDLGLMERGVLNPVRSLGGYHIVEGGIAAGDIHGDGWEDVLVKRPALMPGLSLYANIGGTFQLQALDLGPVDDLEVFNLALADMNNDGQLDLLVSTIQGGDFLFYNQNGSYDADHMIVLNESRFSGIVAFAFGDLDKDGDLDAILGRWGPNGVREGWNRHPNDLRNEILWNRGEDGFELEVMDELGSTTLTLLLSDFDNDGFLDLLKGDDVGPTDEVIYFDEDGWRNVSADEQPFDYYIYSTMSYDSGDWNNDLQLDYYGGQISTAASSDGRKSLASLSRDRKLFDVCQIMADDLGLDTDDIRECAAELASHRRIYSPTSGRGMDGCQQPRTAEHRAICAASYIIRTSTREGGKAEDRVTKFYNRCLNRLQHIPVLQRLCGSVNAPAVPLLTEAQTAERFQSGLVNGNILMTSDGEGGFSDDASAQGVRYPGWSWNSRFFDYDQNGWQDLFVVTGIWRNASFGGSNLFYRNEDGQFADDTEASGLYDPSPTYSYVSLDFDHDGDLDIIRDNSGMSMVVHRNDGAAGNALLVELRDDIGNRFGIGARITICVDGHTDIQPGKCQMREIKASGGFMSTDPAVAHFGLGSARSVDLVRVEWYDGDVSDIYPNGLSAGALRVSRQASQEQ